MKRLFIINRLVKNSLEFVLFLYNLMNFLDFSIITHISKIYNKSTTHLIKKILLICNY